MRRSITLWHPCKHGPLHHPVTICLNTMEAPKGVGGEGGVHGSCLAGHLGWRASWGWKDKGLGFNKTLHPSWLVFEPCWSCDVWSSCGRVPGKCGFLSVGWGGFRIQINLRVTSVQHDVDELNSGMQPNDCLGQMRCLWPVHEQIVVDDPHRGRWYSQVQRLLL